MKLKITVQLYSIDNKSSISYNPVINHFPICLRTKFFQHPDLRNRCFVSILYEATETPRIYLYTSCISIYQ